MRFLMILVLTVILAEKAAAISPDAHSAKETGPAVRPDSAQQTDSLPQIDTMPRIIRFVKAEYPAEQVKRGIEGTVALELVISDSGRVDSVAVAKGLDPALDSNAVRAAKQFLFSPAIAAGRPIPVLMEYAYRFMLSEITDSLKEYVNLQGKLIERGTRAPIVDAIVTVGFVDTTFDTLIKVPFSTYLMKIGRFVGQSLSEGMLQTSTDSTGHFAFKSLPSCSISIKIIAPNFENFHDRERIQLNKRTDVLYRLQRVASGDYEIVVYGKADKKEVAQHTLTLSEVRRIPGVGGDAVKVVQALPGVARASFISGDVIVRGASNDDSRYFLNGVQIPLLYHFGGLKSTYNSDALESVDFYPGGFGTRYGDAIAGIIELKGRPGKTDRWHTSLDANLYDASFLVEGPINKNASLLLTARRSYVGDILGWVVKAMGLPFTIQPYYYDYVGRLDYNLSKSNKFFLTLFGSQDALKLITSSVRGSSSAVANANNQVNEKQYFHMGLAGWNWDISPAVHNDLTYSLTYKRQSMAAFGFMNSEQESWTNALRNQTVITLAKNLKLNCGLDAQIAPTNIYSTSQMGSDTTKSDTTKNWIFGDVAAYVNLEWKPFERLEIIPGIRYDYYPQLNYRGSIIPAFWDYGSFNNRQGTSGEPSLRLSWRYKLSDRHTVKGSIGNYSQSPQPIQSISKSSGDPDLPATKATHYVAGYEWRISDLVSADIQTYYNNQWDIPRSSTSQDIVTGSSEKAKGYIADEKGRMYGLELMLKHDQGKHFYGWLAYSLSRSERWNPHSNGWTLYGKDETHNLQLVGSFRLPRQWEVGLRARYVTGDPTTPIIGKTYDEDKAQYDPIYGATNSARIDPFIQLDLRIEKKFVFNKWLMTTYLDFQNLSYFVHKNAEFYMYNYDYTEKTPVDGIPYPSLGLKCEF